MPHNKRMQMFVDDLYDATCNFIDVLGSISRKYNIDPIDIAECAAGSIIKSAESLKRKEVK